MRLWNCGATRNLKRKIKGLSYLCLEDTFLGESWRMHRILIPRREDILGRKISALEKLRLRKSTTLIKDLWVLWPAQRAWGCRKQQQEDEAECVAKRFSGKHFIICTKEFGLYCVTPETIFTGCELSVFIPAWGFRWHEWIGRDGGRRRWGERVWVFHFPQVIIDGGCKSGEMRRMEEGTWGWIHIIWLLNG